MASIISLNNVFFGYGDKRILHVDTLTLPEEGMVFLIGSSGIGKSTLLESIGLMSNTFMPFADDSRLEIRGVNYDPDILWSQKNDQIFRLRNELFSFIFQSTNLMPDFTVEENILMASKYDQNQYGTIKTRVLELLDEMDLEHAILERFPHEISGGQKQRIAFIRALTSEFYALLADEPTGNLDMQNSHALFKILKNQIVEHKKMALIVTHHLELAQEYGDVIIEIKKDSQGDIARIETKYLTDQIRNSATNGR